MSVVFGLSICTATANSWTVGSENVLCGGGVGDKISTRWVDLHVTAEKMKIYSSIHVGKNITYKMFPKRLDHF
jgi:hypothetical protein